MNRQKLLDAFGWLGAVVLLMAYGLFSLSMLEAGLTYHAMNLLGSIGVGVAAYSRKNYSALFLELAWGCMAIVALGRLIGA